MASLSQVRWPVPAVVSSPGGQAIAADQSRKDPWISLQSPRAVTPVKRAPGSPWDDMGLKQPLFGMVTSPGSDIWKSGSSPLFGSISPCPSATSVCDSPKFTLSPKPFTLPVDSTLSKAVHKISGQLHESVVDANDGEYFAKQLSASSLPFADRATKTFPEPETLSLTPIFNKMASTSPVLTSVVNSAALENEKGSDYSGTNDLWANDVNDCSSGDDSYFCVDSEEQLLKTELCRNWGPPLYHCQYGDTCNFAHGEAELRERIRRGEYKSKLCDEPVRLGVRSCTYTTQQQSRCNCKFPHLDSASNDFQTDCHPGEAVRRKCSRPYFDSEYFTILSKEFPGNGFPFGIFV